MVLMKSNILINYFADSSITVGTSPSYMILPFIHSPYILHAYF